MYRIEKSGAMSLAPMPPLVPAYNKWMGGVDWTNQRSRYYSLNHRCRRPWTRIFLHLFDVTISNAYILYKHNCRSSSTSKVKIALEFHEELVVENFNSRKRKRGSFIPSTGRIHEMVKVEQVGLKRGRCLQCKEKFTLYACAACQACVCVLDTAKCGQKTLFDGLPFYRRKRQNTVDPIDGERFFTVS